MDGYDENLRVAMKPAGFRGHPMEVGNYRRALGEIKNLMGSQPYPCASSKRGSTGRNLVDDETTAFIARRPMTRKFAASLKSQPCSQDSNIVNERRCNKPVISVSHSNCLDTSAPIDVEDYKFANDLPLPMLEETEEIGHPEPKEVEMEDVVTDPVQDIDSCDARNPLEVVDYIEDIYSFHRNMEASGCVCPNYMSNQFDINEKMRAVLIDWLIEVHYKFELMDETLFLTVNVIDRFLALQTVVRKKLQLVGVTAMLLACKYEEVSVPVVDDLIQISDRAYTREQVLEMEKLILNTLQFKMSVPTPYVFMRRFLKAAQSEKKTELLSFFIVEMCLVEYEMLKFRPSMLAAAAIYTAQCTHKEFRHWSRTCELHTSYSEDQLKDCSRMMVDFHQKAGMGKLTGVHRKYSTSKFGCTTIISRPAMFLLDTRL